MYDVLSVVVGSNGGLRDREFHFDFANLGFIRPEGVTCLGNLFELLKVRGNSFSLSLGESSGREAIAYLDDSGFFRIYAGGPLTEGAALRETTFPLSQLSHRDSHYWLREQFIVWLAGRMSQPRGALATVESCLQEVFNNIRDHSTENVASISAQHFPNERGAIRIAVSDFGIGIPNAMRKYFPDLDDAKALKMAIEEGVSSRSLPTNRGMGLDQLIRNIVMRNKGRVVIHSGHGKLTCRLTVQGQLEKFAETLGGYYPGTLIGLYFSTETFVPDEVEREDFEW